MQIKLLFRLLPVAFPLAAICQSTSFRTGTPVYHLLDRLEIKTGRSMANPTFVKPYSRRQVFAGIDSVLADTINLPRLTVVDRYNIAKLTNDPERGTGKNFVSILPVAKAVLSKESNNSLEPYQLAAGLEARGVMFKKLAFQFYGTGNAERLPGYLNRWQTRYPAVPGIGNYRSSGNRRVSYFDFRGSVQTSVATGIDLQLGYDRMFLGEGHRSLFLSDFSNNALFFRLNTRFWKLNFQSLYLKLQHQGGITGKPDTQKFLRFNTLGIDVTRWLNISVFDAVVLGRENGLDLNYLLPITFLRAMEHQSGSPDNALFGVSAKVNIAGRFQLYNQFLLDEFKVSELKAGSGWWANKFGYQLGAKYIDAFGIPNLDLQAETNRLRPFTYSHFDSVSNYSHSNQPLAHPLGANLHEYIGIARYQPSKKWKLQAKLVYYKQGLDSAGLNTGNNVLINYNTRPRNYGWEVGSGDKASCLYLQGNISYEIRKELYIDLSLVSRRFKTTNMGTLNTSMISLGFLWNISRREFDF